MIILKNSAEPHRVCQHSGLEDICHSMKTLLQQKLLTAQRRPSKSSMRHTNSLPQNPNFTARNQHLTVPKNCNTSQQCEVGSPTSKNPLYLSPQKAIQIELERIANEQVGQNFSAGSSGRSSLTGSSFSSGDTDEYIRRASNYSAISTLTESSASGHSAFNSRRSSALSMISESFVAAAPMLARTSDYNYNESQKEQGPIEIRRSTRWKLKRIATQVTRTIRRRRKESIVIRKESRATRIVAAILIVFILCWLPYFIFAINRGILLGIDRNYFTSNLTCQKIYLIFSWLGYMHSMFNPLIYTAFNKNFQKTLRLLLTGKLRCIITANTPSSQRRSPFATIHRTTPNELLRASKKSKTPTISLMSIDNVNVTPKNSIASLHQL